MAKKIDRLKYVYQLCLWRRSMPYCSQCSGAEQAEFARCREWVPRERTRVWCLSFDLSLILWQPSQVTRLILRTL